ncbi:lactonase family protein [Sinomonas mesophila]|uniref:lactonase family protein n=1 Tax=Sinomonas mesophila TaxID=1531955 RepID=UPI00158BA838|nr:beta-propeller fold lactonase family protein [Sinomonas mesophila]
MADQRTLIAIACAGAGAVDTLALDRETGELEPLARTGGLDGVAALAFGPDGTLYAACNAVRPHVVDLALDDAGRAAEGPSRELPASTCFISLAPGGRELYSASYGQGRLDRVPLPGADGAVATYASGRNTHCAAASPDGRFLYATSLGDDRISWFPAGAVGPGSVRGGTADDGVLEPTGHVAAEPGSGPRYLRLNAAGDRAYVNHELSGDIAVYAREPEDGRLELLQRVSAVEGLGLVPGPIRSAGIVDPGPGVVWAADLRLTPDGRFLYTTERSTGTLASFAIRGGLLEYLGRIDTETQPSSAAADPSGRFLLVCGEGSAHVTSYRIGNDGSLSAVSRAATSAGPLWIECRA